MAETWWSKAKTKDRMIASPKVSTVGTIAKTGAQQRLLFQPQEERWYKGDAPTASETVARIYQRFQNDRKTGDSLMSQFYEMQQDPSNPFYEPYRKATNQAVSALQELGADLSGGVTKDWLSANASLMGSYRTGASGTPLAPSGKSTPENDAAYWYYKLLDAEDTTEKAETEWDALREEISYWANRTDRNYSDDEVLQRIDWRKYPTLQKMDEQKQMGVPLTLNRAVGYSKETLNGVLWAARNQTTGDAFLDSVQYELNAGSGYTRDEKTAALLDPTSDQYNPYKTGGTLDDAALYFGVSAFSGDWLDKNRAVLASGDKTAIGYYQDVYQAEQTTKELENQIAVLRARLDIDIEYPGRRSAKELVDDALESGRDSSTYGALTALRKLDESRKSGALISTTRAVDYRYEDMIADVQKRLDLKNAQTKGDAYVNGVTEQAGGKPESNESQQAVNAAKDSAIQNATGDIYAAGTDEEKIVFGSAYSADHPKHIEQIAAAVEDGTLDAKQGYESALKRADEYAAKNYLVYRENLEKVAELEAIRDERMAENEYFNPDEINRQIQELKDDYATIERNYQIANELGALAGETQESDTLRVLEYAYANGGEYIPTVWDTKSSVEGLLDYVSYDQLAPVLTQSVQANLAEIAQIDEIISSLPGIENIENADRCISNLKRRRALLVRNNMDINYLEIGQQVDEKVVEDTKAAVRADYNRYSDTTLAIVMTNSPLWAKEQPLTMEMTDVEKSEYVYLLGTLGEAEAERYYNHLANAEYGVLMTRQSERIGEQTRQDAENSPILSSALSILASPMQITGAFYTLGQLLTGREINPNHTAFATNDFINGTRETVKEKINEACGEGTFGAWLANFGYDLVTTVGDNYARVAAGGGIANVGLLLAGAQSFSQSAQDAKKRGASDAQAALYAGVTAITEVATEKLPMDELLKSFKAGGGKTVRAAVTSMLKGVLTEAPGEMLAEAVEGISDTLIMDELSSREAAIREYMKSMSPEEAEKQADRDFWNGVLYAGLLGGASGAMGNLIAYKSAPTGAAQENKAGNNPTPGEGASTGLKTGFIAKQVQALESALTTTDEASRTATVAGVLATGHKENIPTLSAAAQHMTAEYGSEKTVRATQRIILEANKASLDMNDVSAAMSAAALTDGESHAALTELMNGNVTPEAIRDLMAKAKADIETQGDKIDSTVFENQVSQRVKELVAEGGLDGIKSYEDAERQAKQNLDKSKGELDAAKKDCDTAGKNLQSLHALWTKGNTPATMGAVQQATKDVEGKAKVLKQAEQTVKSYEEQYSQAKKTYEDMRAITLKNLREQALQDMTAQREQEAAARDEQAQIAAQEKETRRATVNGRETHVSRIKEITPESVILETEQGDAPLDGALFADEKTGDLYAEAKGMDADAANQMIAGFSGEDALTYAKDFKAVYNRAKLGAKYDSTLGASLTDEQRKAAYEAGARQKQGGKGGVIRAYSNEAVQITQHPKQTRTSIRVLDALGKKYGRTIVLEDSIAIADSDGKTRSGVANGYYDDRSGEIHIALDAQDGAYLFYGVHELTHTLEGTDSYDALASFVESRIGTDDMQKRMGEITSLYGHVGVTLDETAAKREVIANALPAILTDESIVRELVSTDRTLAERIRDFFQDFFDHLQNALVNVTAGDNSEMNEFWRLANDADAVRQAWAMLDQALGGKSNAGRGVAFAVKQLPDGRKYVEADRNVIHGSDSSKWSGQIIAYINDTMRKGKDIVVYAADGDPLTISRDTAGKAAFRNYVTDKSGKKRLMTDDEYATKLRAEAHIDELAETSRHGKVTVPDNKKHRFAKDGFNYRTAYFLDPTGYYRVTMSVGVNGSINTIYNVGKMDETNSPRFVNAQRQTTTSLSGSQAEGESVSDSSIPNSGENVKKFSVRVSDTFKLTGEPTSQLMLNAVEALSNGDAVSLEDIARLPEVEWVRNQIFDLFGETQSIDLDAKKRQPVRDKVFGELMALGSAQAVTIDGKQKIQYNGDVARERRADIVIGVPAAGKSSVLVDPLSEKHKSRVIDSDMAKERLPEYRDGLGAGYLHEESGEIIERVQAEAMLSGENIVYAIVGGKEASVQKRIDLLRRNGYSVYLHLNELPSTKAIGRAMNRFLSTGRFINPGYLMSVGDKPSAVYEALKGEADGYSKYSNDVPFGSPPICYETSGGDVHPDYAGRGQRGSSPATAGQAQSTDRSGASAQELGAGDHPSAFSDGRKYSLRTPAETKTAILRTRDNAETGDAEAIAKAALQEVQSRQNRRTFIDEVKTVLTYLNTETDPDVGAAMDTLTDACRTALEKANTIDTAHQEYVAPVREYLKNTRISLNQGQKDEAASRFDSYQNYRRSLFGAVKLTNDGEGLDSAWRKLSEINPTLFPADANEGDQPALLYAAAQAIKPRTINNFADDIDTAAGDMAQRLVDEYFHIGAENTDASTRKAEFEKTLAQMPDKSIENKVRAVRDNAAQKRGVSQFAGKTGQNTHALSDRIKKLLRDSPFYQKMTQKESLERAIAKIETEGYESRVSSLLMDDAYLATPNGQVEAYALVKIAANAGDTVNESALAFKIKDSGTQLGQALAMRRLYLELTPAGKQAYVQRIVDQINQRYENKGKKARVTAPEWLSDALKSADGDEAKVNEALDRAYREIAKQMPRTFWDSVNTWRYLSMLGNPLTHIKNIVSNAAFAPMVMVKNKLAAGMEATFNTERTKNLASLRAEYLDFAKAVTRDQRDALMGGGKYNDGKGKIEDYRQKAPAIIDKLSKWNMSLLSGEDLLFKNVYFTNALAGYLQANKVDLNNIDEAVYRQAVEYATGEAMKNTYNNVNYFAKWLNNAEKTAGKRWISTAISAVIPFKNTPANIVARGVDYNALGLIKTLTVDAVRLKQGKITVNQFIDNLSAGLTGTGVMLLGALLQAIGVLNAGEDKDDELRGTEKNSITLLGVEIGIDGLGLAAMPLLAGCTMFKSLQERFKDGAAWEDVYGAMTDALKSTVDPIMELSMMKGLNGMLSSAAYSDNALGEMGGRIITSFLGQFVPSLSGAIARTVDDTRRTTYTDKNILMDAEAQYFLQSVRNKIPFLSQESLPYMDAWGENETSTPLERIASNFLIPGYPKQMKTLDDVETALLAMYEQYGDDSLLPKKANKSFRVQGETRYLTQDEYDVNAKRRGSLAKEILRGLLTSGAFLGADAEYQIKAVNNAYTYATMTANYETDNRYAIDKWIAADGDPTQKVLDKMAGDIKSDRIATYKESLFDAIDDLDVGSIRLCVAGLQEEGKKTSDIKSAVTERYKPLMKELYANDTVGYYALEEKLLETGLGYERKDFNAWLKEK